MNMLLLSHCPEVGQSRGPSVPPLGYRAQVTSVGGGWEKSTQSPSAKPS